jgi:voltage-gated potassium channel
VTPPPRTDVAGRRARALARQRGRLLARIARALDVPMIVLAFVWLVLTVVELTLGLGPLLEALGIAIWAVFVVNFAVEISIAPDRLAYLRHNWLTTLSLLAPALRMLRLVRMVRLLRATRVTRGMRLLKVLGSLNRGLRVLAASMVRRGFGYVVALTMVVTAGGAAGMYALERDLPGGPGFADFGTALWWTAMLMTTMGSDYWPRSPEARLLCLLLALYAFAVFGYVTAALASFFVGRDARDSGGEVAGAAQIERLRLELAELRRATAPPVGQARRTPGRSPRTAAATPAGRGRRLGRPSGRPRSARRWRP